MLGTDVVASSIVTGSITDILGTVSLVTEPGVAGVGRGRRPGEKARAEDAVAVAFSDGIVCVSGGLGSGRALGTVEVKVFGSGNGVANLDGGLKRATVREGDVVAAGVGCRIVDIEIIDGLVARTPVRHR